MKVVSIVWDGKNEDAIRKAFSHISHLCIFSDVEANRKHKWAFLNRDPANPKLYVRQGFVVYNWCGWGSTDFFCLPGDKITLGKDGILRKS